MLRGYGESRARLTIRPPRQAPYLRACAKDTGGHASHDLAFWLAPYDTRRGPDDRPVNSVYGGGNLRHLSDSLPGTAWIESAWKGPPGVRSATPHTPRPGRCAICQTRISRLPAAMPSKTVWPSNRPFKTKRFSRGCSVSTASGRLPGSGTRLESDILSLWKDSSPRCGSFMTSTSHSKSRSSPGSSHVFGCWDAASTSRSFPTGSGVLLAGLPIS